VEDSAINLGDEPGMNPEYDLSRDKKLQVIWVNAYRISRHYGGPEEGGWYYDWNTCIASMPVLNGTKTTQARIDFIIEWMQETLGWESEHNRYSVLGDADFAVYVEDLYQESETTERPHYE
jgi:hypothetical protein